MIRLIRLIRVLFFLLADKLLGGADFFNDSALAVVDAPNLTRGQGGVAAQLTDADWVRAIRHGGGPDGRPLFIMPSRNYYFFSDEDLEQIIAYLKNAPPVDRPIRARTTTLLGRVLLSAGAFGDLIDAESIDHTAPRPVAPAPDVDEQTFLTTIRTRQSQWMAFTALNHMTDAELQALWRYLQSLPPQETVAAQ